MIPVTDLRAGAIFLDEGKPFQVARYFHTKMGRGKAIIRLKVKNLKTGATLEKVFDSGTKVAEADVNTISVQFLYQTASELNFTNPQTGQKITLSKLQHPLAGDFLAKDMEVRLWQFEGQPLSIELPPTVELTVKETGPGVKGNSATNVYKPATLESGYQLQVPLFVEEGDMIRVNTESGKYVSRV